MHFLSALACFVAWAAASPTIQNLPVGDGARFSLEQVENVKYTSSETGLDSRLWAYVKYNAQIPDSLQEAIRIGEHVNARFKSLVGRSEYHGDPSVGFSLTSLEKTSAPSSALPWHSLPWI